MIRRIESTSFTSNLHLKFCDSPLESKELLLQGGLFSFKRSDLLLDSAILCLLEVEMPLPA
jgi:hypothetical protein